MIPDPAMHKGILPEGGGGVGIAVKGGPNGGGPEGRGVGDGGQNDISDLSRKRGFFHPKV